MTQKINHHASEVTSEAHILVCTWIPNRKRVAAGKQPPETLREPFQEGPANQHGAGSPRGWAATADKNIGSATGP